MITNTTNTNNVQQLTNNVHKLTQQELKEFKHAIKEMKSFIIDLDNQSFKYIKSYKIHQYKYADAFDYDYNKLKLFTRKLDSNQTIDNNIYIADQIVESFYNKYKINIRDFDSFTHKKYLSIYLDNKLDEYKRNKIDVILKAFRKSII